MKRNKIRITISNNQGEVLEMYWIEREIEIPNVKSPSELDNRLAADVIETLARKYEMREAG